MKKDVDYYKRLHRQACLRLKIANIKLISARVEERKAIKTLEKMTQRYELLERRFEANFKMLRESADSISGDSNAV